MKTESKPLRILIADDHNVVRSGVIRSLVTAFPGVITAEASNSQEVTVLLKESTWDIVILDISMPGRNGMEMLNEIVLLYPGTRVIIFSMYPEDHYAVRAIRAGASAYITKDTPLRKLNEAIYRISHGERYLSPSVAELLANELYVHHGTKQPHQELSDREYQVFQLIASGKPVSVIAAELSLSVKTISVYRSKILSKLGLNNNAEITHYAFRNSLVE